MHRAFASAITPLLQANKLAYEIEHSELIRLPQNADALHRGKGNGSKDGPAPGQGGFSQ